MADRAVSDLIEAEQLTKADLFLLEQGGTAKKLTGQTLIAFLTALADGHGGISKIEKTGSEGITDAYRITLADGNTFEYTVTNGEKGDKGDNAYTWIKYASQEPTEGAHSMSDLPDGWMGVYTGHLAEAPEDWRQYRWFEIKGEKGDKGVPATVVSASVGYQVGTSASAIPEGEWSEAIPETPQGAYLWSRTVTQYNTGEPVTVYAVSRIGMDGLGTVRTVNGIQADDNGNIALSADSVGAIAKTGGNLAGMLDARGNKITGLPTPENDTDAVPLGAVRDLEVMAWNNASPNSEYASQTINISDAKNKTASETAVIYLQAHTGDAALIASGALPLGKTSYQFRLFCPTTDGSGFAYRDVQLIHMGSYVRATFGNAYRGTNVDNGYLVPVWINLIRKVG